VQRNFIETRDFQFDLLSDPEFEFYVEAGITAPGTGSINRGILVYDPAGEIVFTEITENPAAAFLNFLNL
jgi:peroxiredoxin